MEGEARFNPRSDAKRPRDEPGQGDDIPCVMCGAVALDTGLECDECGYDNHEAVTGRPFRPRLVNGKGRDSWAGAIEEADAVLAQSDIKTTEQPNHDNASVYLLR